MTIHTLPNEQGISSFALTVRYMVSQDPATGRPFVGVIEVEWEGPSRVDLMTFEEHVAKLTRGTVAPEALLGKVFDDFIAALMPSSILVKVTIETIAHGPYTILKGGGTNVSSEEKV